MNKPSDYLLLIRNTNWQEGASPQELEETLGRFMAWVDGIHASGKLRGANPLMNEGKVISGASGRTVFDGPFAEAKEAIGGYFLLSVADMDEAVAIAQRCPGLDYGATVEVRPVAPECPMLSALRETPELAHA